MSRKILQIVSSPETSGVTAMIRSLILALTDAGWSLALVHYGRKAGIALDLASRGIPVFRIAAPPLWTGVLRTQWVLKRLSQIMRHLSPDLVHAHSFDADMLSARALPDGPPPLLVTCHSFSYADWVRGHTETYRRWGHRLGLLVSVCSSLRDAVASFPSLSATPSRVIFNAPDSRFFLPLASGEREASRSALGFSAEDMVIGSVANFHPVKGHEVLAAAFSQLSRRHPRVRLLIMGSAGQDPSRIEVRSRFETMLARELSDARVVVVDTAKDSRPILAATDIYIQPSHTEALSVALTEAMACGLPIIATAVGGNPEIILDGKTGRLIPPGDPHAMATAIENLLFDHDAKKSLRESAAAFARQRLTPEAAFSSYLQAYEDLLRRNL